MNQEGVSACCAVCNEQTNKRCAGCNNMYYCTKEHQRQDWPRHKSECGPKEQIQETRNEIQDCSESKEPPKKVEEEPPKKEEEDRECREAKNKEGSESTSETELSKNNQTKNLKDGSNINSDNKQDSEIAAEQAKQSESVEDKVESCTDSSVTSSVVYTDRTLSTGSAITHEGSSEQEILRGSTQQLSADFAMASSSNVLRTLNRTDMRMPQTFRDTQQHSSSSRKEYPEASLRNSVAPFTGTQNSFHMDPSDPCYDICQRVIRDMTQYGVCVLDNFLGKDRGHLVLNEVLEMYKSGIFQKGQLVSNPSVSEAQTIRSDLITWIDGKESHCYHIRQLISYVDQIVLKANKIANNGKMGDYVINGRTMAMVACYPGSGSHYVKHVDNPNKDGRCITAIYYLNTDWDVNRYGGLLRVFPEGTNKVADIAPIFDRMLFFWSDRRNPHEVQPAYATRYAITLWYFDAHERAEARRQFKQRGQPQTPPATSADK